MNQEQLQRVAKEEAARAYDAWAREVHGEFAYLNFHDGGQVD